MSLYLGKSALHITILPIMFSIFVCFFLCLNISPSTDKKAAVHCVRYSFVVIKQ